MIIPRFRLENSKNNFVFKERTHSKWNRLLLDIREVASHETLKNKLQAHTCKNILREANTESDHSFDNKSLINELDNG